MTSSSDNHVKVLFRFYSEVLEDETVETLWATTVDVEKNLYQVDNIPFYVPSIAPGDVVLAELNKAEGRLTYRQTVVYSGNSVIQIVIMDDKTAINRLRDLFKRSGCNSERANDGYFCLEIPADLDYRPIQKILAELEANETIGYAESCLAEKHRNEVYG